MFGAPVMEELKVKEPHAPGLPQVTDQVTRGFEEWVTPALTGIDALIAREVGMVSTKKTEIGCDGNVGVIGAEPRHPANAPIMPMPKSRIIAWRHFMVRLPLEMSIHVFVSCG